MRYLSQQSFFFFLIFVVGFLFVFIIPPFQKPDEATHYLKTISIASGNIICTQTNGQLTNSIPYYLSEFPQQLLSDMVSRDTTIRISLRRYVGLLSQQSFDTTPVNNILPCSQPPFFYIPAALFLSPFILLKANPLIIFYLGRIINYLIGIAILYKAFKVMPEKWRIVALVFISFPIVLHQLTSYSKDMYHLSLGFLLISYLIAWYQREKPFTYKELFSYAGLLVVFILTRPQYIPFVLILFLLRSKNENISNIFLLKRLGLAAAVIGLTGFILLISSKLGIYTSSQILTEPYEVQQYVFPDLQLLYILDNPLRFLQIIVNTLDEKFYSYYLKETIAVLGSNDTFLPDIIYITYIGILAYLVFALRRIVRAFQRIDIILLSIISVATGLLVFIMMYLYGTPVSADSIGYVQGRYFTMLLPFIIIVSTYIIDRTKQYLPFVFISFTIISVIWASFDRFFNTYDYYYSAAPESVKSAFKISKGNKDHLAIKQIHHLQLDSSRKTRGLTFFVSEREEYKPENFKAQKPFTLHVYERSCRILHQSKVINMQEIKQGWNDVILDKIITGQDKICIQISGMDRDEKNYGEIRVLKDNEKQQVLYPLYLY